MKTYVSILRGINVSGHRLIKMDSLRQLLTNLGFQNLQTYIQSGNIVFKFKKSGPKQLETIISKAISDKFAFDVPVIVKELEVFKQIVSNNPYLTNQTKDPAHLHVTFLSDKPDQECFDNLKAGHNQADEFQLVDKEIYLYCPNGYGNTKLTNSFFENKLNVSATTRNWKTTIELLKMALEI